MRKKLFSDRNHEMTKNQHMRMPRNFLSEIFRISDAFFASGNCPLRKLRHGMHSDEAKIESEVSDELDFPKQNIGEETIENNLKCSLSLR